ncbi:hypothetical protein FVEN_g3683 [Fusarium venenatum]|uniref:Protein kinase domain-containing protein n=1 Tax=Fusarium venenatum TaxID=56646 RepID=A0A2L2T3Z2_9HYPO|nr:uncharacterized protein FVRRES_13644 [Fusarium venenatum]KAG8358655.1 hypothetical protein FVEN_g3683 [Fusarium venenatum]CEI41580.1 unnamed protein product [Fusarium venenatum]
MHRFLKHQRPFYTIVVGDPDRAEIRNDDQRTLPWLPVKKIGQGTYGVVSKVEVTEGRLTKVRDFNQTIGKPEVIARKDFIPETAEASFQKEWQAIKSEGQLSIFSLLMPLADMDLAKYIERYPEAIVNDTIARQRIIKAAMGLTDRLDFLHSVLKMQDGEENLICYLMDPKPGNILVFNVASVIAWKLSYFGLSRVKRKAKPDISDLSRILKKRGSDQ